MSGAAPSEDPDDLRRLAEASAWRVSLTEADLDTSPQVEAWLASHEANRAAWKQVQDSWSLFDSPAATVQVTAMRRAALARRRPRPMRRAEPWMWRSAAAAACAVVVGLGLWLSLQPQTYETARGERRSLVLQDGSRVAMDSDTLLQVRLTRGARRLDLVRGQARFDVAHDKARPFTVHVGDEAVVATGTSFDIDKLGSKVTVTLIEGRVSVLEDAAGGLAPFATTPTRHVRAKLVAGQRLLTSSAASPGSTATGPSPRVEKADLDQAAAWQSGQLIFDNEPLGSVVERVSRYSPHPIVADGAAADLRLSGVFNASAAASFSDTVQQVLPVVAEPGPDGVIHVRTRG